MDFKKVLTLVLLISMVLITGCININVEQKLKRNGHYDLDLTISTSPEYKILLNGVKEDLQVDDSVRDRFEYRETDTSITYSFKDIDPSKHKLLFKKVEEKPGGDNVFGQTQQTPDFSFINPENVEFKKEFKFPYYEFTYKLKVTPPIEEDLKKPETLSVNEYILDEAGVLDQESKNEIMQSINNVYKNDSVEIIVVTKKQMTAMDYFSYKLDFINSFDFKNKNKQYVLVFASTNEDGICRVESNIFDSKASSKVRSLNRDFSKNCKTDYSSQIKNVVLQLDKFFQSHDLTSSKQVEEQIKQLFKISYTVKVFGKITDTNGLKMEGNKVKFDINPFKEGEYIIVFKDFFIATMLGDAYWVYLLVLGVVLVGLAGFIVFSKIKKKQEKPLKPPLAVNPKLLEYIKRARASGMTDAQIKNVLIKNGWSARDVDIALKYSR